MPPPPRTTHAGPVVLGVTLGLIFLIAFGVMGVALLTRRPPAPPPQLRRDPPTTGVPHDTPAPRAGTSR